MKNVEEQTSVFESKVLAFCRELNSITYSSYAKLFFVDENEIDWGAEEKNTSQASVLNIRLNETPWGNREQMETEENEPQKDVRKTFFIFHVWLSSHTKERGKWGLGSVKKLNWDKNPILRNIKTKPPLWASSRSDKSL